MNRKAELAMRLGETMEKMADLTEKGHMNEEAYRVVRKILRRLGMCSSYSLPAERAHLCQESRRCFG